MDLTHISNLLSKICRYQEFYYVCNYLDFIDFEDFHQDCLIRFHQRSHHFNPDKGSIKTFLRMIVKQVTSEYYRKTRITQEYRPDRLDSFPVSGRSMSLDLRDAIQELPHSTRIVMRMSADGFNGREIEYTLRIDRRRRKCLYEQGLSELRSLMN